MGRAAEWGSVVSVLVKFKNDEICPCLLDPVHPEEQDAWAATRGMPVRLGRVIPLSEVPDDMICGSDTYWEIKDENIRALVAAAIGDTYDLMIVCRHCLEMGD